MQLFLVVVVFLLLAAGFALYLIRRDQGEKEPVGPLWVAFGCGAVGLVVAGTVEYFLLPDVFTEPQTLGTLAWVAVAIAVVEELCKCLLLIWFLYGKRYFNEHTDGVLYFALAGLGFGLPENLLYTFEFGPETGMGRLVMTPLFHAATTALIGFAVAKVKVDKAPKRTLVMTVLGVIALHALYDYGLFSQIPILVLLSIMITAGLGAGLFLLFMHARTLDQEKGLSVVGHNSFCRSCGYPNPDNSLYCSSCGQRA